MRLYGFIRNALRQRALHDVTTVLRGPDTSFRSELIEVMYRAS